VLSSSDSQVCYNCHGSDHVGEPAAGSNGHNIQAELYAIPGQSLPGSGSLHPVSAPGASTSGLTCTNCHDPHLDPVSSPKLLRAYDPITRKAIASANGTTPGSAYCWTCHGVRTNRTIDARVSGYWGRTGGDKKTTFNGAHTALGTATWRFDSEVELKRGYTSSTEVRAGGTVALAGTVMVPKTPIPPIASDPTHGDFYGITYDPSVVYDGRLGTGLQWFGTDIGAAGASNSNPATGTATLTMDLGTATRVQSFEFDFLYEPQTGAGAFAPDVLQIQTSDDSATWLTAVSQGTIGTRLGDHLVINAPGTSRYVRFVFSRRFVAPMHSIIPVEISLYASPSQGTYEVWLDIARKAAYSGGVVKWTSTEPASTSVSVTVRASTDRGSTWTAWQSVANGGALTQIPTGASLQNARLQIRSTLTGAQASPILDSLEVSMDRGAIVGATPAWSGASPANECARCHTGHASASAGLVTEGSTAACKTCHSAAYGGSYVGSAQFASSRHAAVPCADCHTAHGKANGTGLTYGFLLKADRADACLACHATVKGAFDAKQGAASEWAKHDIYSTDQVRTGSTLACRSCHGTHFSSTGLVDPDSVGTAFTTMRDDPTSIPTSEVVIYATKDTSLESTVGQQTWNYGASSQVTITPSSRALLYFDLSAIPASATIQNATLVLWGTSTDYHTYTGGFNVYPVTRYWVEGEGSGDPNSASINGASWLERSFGTTWTVQGGDYVTSPTASRGGLNALSVTDLVQSLHDGANYGLLVTPADAATYLPIYTRESATVQYRPKLRVWYQTGLATRRVVDDITFCSKCHDGSMPVGLTGQSISAVASMYAYGAHGGGKGLGPESSIFDFFGADRGGGGLKAPYSYGMDPLPCTTCHDPHGSRLPYHLREVVNGQSVVPLYGYGWGYEGATQGAGLGYFCAACHIFPPNHSGYEISLSNCSSGCHNHAGH
jgi:predicted CXXCH cytochrome family protein